MEFELASCHILTILICHGIGSAVNAGQVRTLHKTFCEVAAHKEVEKEEKDQGHGKDGGGAVKALIGTLSAPLEHAGKHAGKDEASIKKVSPQCCKFQESAHWPMKKVPGHTFSQAARHQVVLNCATLIENNLHRQGLVGNCCQLHALSLAERATTCTGLEAATAGGAHVLPLGPRPKWKDQLCRVLHNTISLCRGSSRPREDKV